MDLTEAEENKNRWQEYTEELYKKDLNDPDNHDGVTTHLEPDILEYEVKRALGSIPTNKASGSEGIPAELFKTPKDGSVKSAAFSMSANLDKPEMATGLEKTSFPSKPKDRAVPENVQATMLALISHASKVMLKILQARAQQYMNQELPYV